MLVLVLFIVVVYTSNGAGYYSEVYVYFFLYDFLHLQKFQRRLVPPKPVKHNKKHARSKSFQDFMPLVND